MDERDLDRLVDLYIWQDRVTSEYSVEIEREHV